MGDENSQRIRTMERRSILMGAHDDIRFQCLTLTTEFIRIGECYDSASTNVASSITSYFKFRGHPFMTSTRRVGGSQAGVDAWGRGEGVQPHVDVHTEN